MSTVGLRRRRQPLFFFLSTQPSSCPDHLVSPTLYSQHRRPLAYPVPPCLSNSVVFVTGNANKLREVQVSAHSWKLYKYLDLLTMCFSFGSSSFIDRPTSSLSFQAILSKDSQGIQVTSQAIEDLPEIQGTTVDVAKAKCSAAAIEVSTA